LITGSSKTPQKISSDFKPAAQPTARLIEESAPPVRKEAKNVQAATAHAAQETPTVKKDWNKELNQLGNESKIFFSRMSLPMSNMVEIISAHKIYTDGKIKILKPLLDKALSILTTEFGLTDPLA